MKSFYQLIAALITSTSSWAACSGSSPNLTAASPSVTDITDCVTASVDGDTINVPAGSSTWAATVPSGSAMITITKGIKLKGAGIGNTNITLTNSDGGVGIIFQNLGSKFFEVTGFTFTNNATAKNFTLQVGQNWSDSNTNYRIHSIYFEMSNSSSAVDADGVLLFGTCEGVIDHCTFHCTTNGAKHGVELDGDSNNPIVQNNLLSSFPSGSSWASTLVLGDQHRAFIEDCTFDFQFKNDAAVEGYAGAKYAVRHCILNNTIIGNHGLDSGNVSSHSYEIYDNVFNNTNNYNNVQFETRGGTGVVWGNSLVDPGGTLGAFALNLENYRATGQSIFLLPDTGFAITGSSWYDTNTAGTTGSLSGATPTGWVALEQVGSTGPITLTGGHFVSTSAPIYEWSNTSGPSSGSQTQGEQIQIGPGFTNLRTSGTDLVIDATTNTKVISASHNFVTTGALTDDQYSWLNITSGTGFTTGWYRILSTASNAATVDRAIGTTGSTGGNWTEYYTNIIPTDIIQSGRDYIINTSKPGYTAYTYPHPLAGGATPTPTPTPTPVAAPTNLRTAMQTVIRRRQ